MHLPALSRGFATTDTHDASVDTTVSEKCVHVSLNMGHLLAELLAVVGICVFVVKYTFHDAYVSVAFIDESILRKKSVSLFQSNPVQSPKQDLSY